METNTGSPSQQSVGFTQFLGIYPERYGEYVLNVEEWDSEKETLQEYLLSPCRWYTFQTAASVAAWQEPDRTKVISLLLDSAKPKEYIFAGIYQIDDVSFSHVVSHEIPEYAGYKGKLRIRVKSSFRRHSPFYLELFEEKIESCTLGSCEDAAADCAQEWPSPPQKVPGRYQERYVDNGNETFTDTQTGLLWMTYCFGVEMWLAAIPACNRTAGRSWRIPTSKELMSVAPVLQGRTSLIIECKKLDVWPSSLRRLNPSESVFLASDKKRFRIRRHVCEVDLRTLTTRFRRYFKTSGCLVWLVSD